jgi:GTP pyrophosphokinase
MLGPSAVSEGHVSVQTVANMLWRLTNKNDIDEILHPPVAEPQPRGASLIIVDGLDDRMVSLAQCCNPAPGSDILGFVTHGRGIRIHRQDCVNADDLRRKQNRLIHVAWNVSRPQCSG